MFDKLLESGRRSSLLPSWGRGVALTLHVAVLGVLWRAPAPPAPDVPIVISETPFQPPPIAATRNGVPPAPPSPIEQQWTLLPPPSIPGIPESSLSPPILETSGTPQPTGPITSGSTEDVYPVALVQEAPELLTAPPPTYPVLLREAGVQGRVIVAAVVDTLGRAEPVRSGSC